MMYNNSMMHTIANPLKAKTFLIVASNALAVPHQSLNHCNCCTMNVLTQDGAFAKGA